MSLAGTTTLRKSLFSHNFVWDSNLFFVLRKWKQFRQQKSPLVFDGIPLNNADSSFITR